MRNRTIILIAVSLIVSLSGCSTLIPVDKTKNGSMDSQRKYIEEARFEFGPRDKVQKPLMYNGTDIEMHYFYNCLGSSNQQGFMIFINGILQPYNLYGSKKSESMRIFNIEKNRKLDFDILFNPVGGKTGHKYGMYAITMYNPLYKPPKGYLGFGNNHKITQVSPLNVQFMSTPKQIETNISSGYTKQTITNELRAKYNGIKQWSNGMKDMLQTSTIFNLYSDPNDLGLIKASDNNLSLTLEGLGGASAEYRTSIYIDNQQIEADGKYDYLDMQLTSGMICKRNFTVDVKKYKGTHIIYTISVPIDDDYLKKYVSVVKSDSRLFEVK